MDRDDRATVYLRRLRREVEAIRSDVDALEGRLADHALTVATYRELLAAAWRVIEDLRDHGESARA